MATVYISFTTTARAHRSDAINNVGKAGASNVSPLTDLEWNKLRGVIHEAFGALNPASMDSTATCSLSLVSGTSVLLSLTA